MRQLVPTSNEVPALLEQVSTAARRVDLDINTVTPEPVIEGEQFDTYRYKLTVIGGYHALAEFLTNVGSLTRIVAPVNLELEPSSGQGAATARAASVDRPMLTSKFEIQTYVAKQSRRGRRRAAFASDEAGGENMTTIREQYPGRLSRARRASSQAIGLAFAVGVVTPSPAAAQSQMLTGPKQAAMRAAAAPMPKRRRCRTRTPSPRPSRRPSRPRHRSRRADPRHRSSRAHQLPPAAAKPVAAARPVPGAAGKGAVAPAGAAPVASTAKRPRPQGPRRRCRHWPRPHPPRRPPRGPTAATSGGDSAGSISVTERGVKGEVSLNREVFSYDASGRRDPFISLDALG